MVASQVVSGTFGALTGMLLALLVVASLPSGTESTLEGSFFTVGSVSLPWMFLIQFVGACVGVFTVLSIHRRVLRRPSGE